MKGPYVIIAPHADDEIIGCHTLLTQGLVSDVFFCMDTGMEETLLSAQKFGFVVHHINELPMSNNCVYLFPDHTHELHPLHRHFGNMGEIMLRDGYEVLFYSTNMNAPYIHEVLYPEMKRRDLEQCYSRKKSLWEYDHRYFLFEGYVKWITTFMK